MRMRYDLNIQFRLFFYEYYFVPSRDVPGTWISNGDMTLGPLFAGEAPLPFLGVNFQASRAQQGVWDYFCISWEIAMFSYISSFQGSKVFFIVSFGVREVKGPEFPHYNVGFRKAFCNGRNSPWQLYRGAKLKKGWLTWDCRKQGLGKCTLCSAAFDNWLRLGTNEKVLL